MKLEFKKEYLIGISVAVILIVLNFFLFWGTRWFYTVLILALSMGWLQFWIDFFTELKRQKEIEVRFLDFIRNMVSAVKSGASIPQAIKRSGKDSYGALDPYIKKLVRQIEWGIPVRKCFMTFANDTRNKVIKRSMSIIIEAEESGGEISDVLESVVESVLTLKKMKDDQKSTAYSQVVQGYIIFFFFIGIMLLLQLKLFPQLTGLGTTGDVSGIAVIPGFGGASEAEAHFSLDRMFFYLIVVQGLFAGLMIGKFSEGKFQKGILHSLILITFAVLIITTIKGGI